MDATVSDTGDVEISTSNVAAMRLMRDVATDAVIDGTVLECRSAADGLLPDVFYVKGAAGWQVLDYDDSRGFSDNPEVRKRPGLQGLIDDAFMSSFVCVRGTGTPWNEDVGAWSQWTLNRFAKEFAQWMRGAVQVVDDVSLDDEMIASSHLVLFGDPGSNAVLSRIADRLPIQWTKDTLRIGDQECSARDHGVSLIFPNPLNPAKYVVLNSCHTFHEKDFRSSNAWLFPRLGDIAIQKISRGNSADFTEQTVHADVFDAAWRLKKP